MSPSRVRGLVLACGAGLALLAMPASSEACQCLDWLWPWNWCRGTASSTTFQPAYVAPNYTPPQTCSYVPQTSYRSVSRIMPMTTCRPVTCSDPCTGCPVTYYRPMTSLVRTTQLIPYTTYRMVWSNPCTPCATTNACATGCGTSCGSYAPMSTTTSGGCSSCGTPSALPPSLPSNATPAPATSTPAPATSTPAPATSTPAPATQSAPPSAPNGSRTFKKEVIEQPPLDPVPDKEPTATPSSLRSPQLINPTDHTTARPIQQAAYYQPVSRQPAPTLDFGGWRASGN